MNLIRELLLKLEALSQDAYSIYSLDKDDEELQVAGYSPDQIGYHLRLLREASLITPPDGGRMSGAINFTRLTWKGHDFVDSVRDPEVWAKTQAGARNAGAFTMELLKDLAVGFIRKKVMDQTGIEI